MSSRSIGLRPGMGGSNDFMNRDRMATYQAIVTNKRRLRWTVALHILLTLLMLFRLSVALCVLSNLRPPRFLQRLNLPRAAPWEYVWLFGGGLFATLAGHMGLSRNRILYVRAYTVATSTFGLTSALFALYKLYTPLRQYWESHEPGRQGMLFGQPVVVMWYMFLIAAVQVHVYGVVFARGLLNAWRVRLEEKKKGL